MSSIAVRNFLVTDEDEIVRLSNARFDRLHSNPPKDSLAAFAGQRVRWAEIIVELENRKPSNVLRDAYYYLHFGSDGCLNVDHYMQDAALVVDASFPNFFVEDEPHNVINAQQKFAKRKRDHSVWWKPHGPLKRKIFDAAMGRLKYRRL